jgi:P27 family predicted phage terminase small subunit
MSQPRTPRRLRILQEDRPPEPAVASQGIGVPRAPSWLPREAQKEWRRVVRAVAVAGYPAWIQELDRAALVGYCLSWATFLEAARDVATRGQIVEGRSSPDRSRWVRNVSVSIMRDAGAQLRAWCRELGFTPDARGRVDVGSFEKHDELEDLLTGPRAVP